MVYAPYVLPVLGFLDHDLLVSDSAAAYFSLCDWCLLRGEAFRGGVKAGAKEIAVVDGDVIAPAGEILDRMVPAAQDKDVVTHNSSAWNSKRDPPPAEAVSMKKAVCYSL